MQTRARWILWLSLLTLTFGAAIYPTADTAPAKKRSHGATAVHDLLTHPVKAPAILASRVIVNGLPELQHDPFDPVTWDLPPPPPLPPPVQVQAPAPPPAPTEPPMPYQYMGRMKDDDGTTVIYLTKGQESVVAHVGENLDANYKLVAIDDDKLTIAYLPMGHIHDISLERH